MKAFLNKTFKLDANKTTVKTEIIAGLATFFTMAYIIFVNPTILGDAGMNKQSVFLATCLAAAVGSVLIGLLANLPFAQASGMGLNAFFAYTICGTLGYSWQAALAAVFVSGLLFIVLSVTGLREAIVRAIPNCLKKGISAGIGLFIAYIGFCNAKMIDFSGVAFGGVPAISFSSPFTWLAMIGLVITGVLMSKKVKGSIFIGILAATAGGMLLALFVPGASFAEKCASFGIYLPTSLSLDFGGWETFGAVFSGFGELFKLGTSAFVMISSVVIVLLSLTMVDMFDTIGTLIGTAAKGGFLDKEGNLPNASKALLADAIATSVGAVLGTSTVTTFVESGAGIAEGGKTGLTSIVVAIMFVLSIFLAPVLGIISAAATAPALIIVGVLMMGSLKDINWENFAEAFPVFAIMIGMCVFYSISDGIALGLIFYIATHIATGKAKQISPVLYVIAALFAFRYVLLTLIATGII